MDINGNIVHPVWTSEDFSREADEAGALHADLSAKAVRLEDEFSQTQRLVVERGASAEDAVVLKALESSVFVVRAEAEAWGQVYSIATEAAIACRVREEAEAAARAEAAAEARSVAAARAAAGRAQKEAMAAREARAAAEARAGVALPTSTALPPCHSLWGEKPISPSSDYTR